MSRIESETVMTLSSISVEGVVSKSATWDSWRIIIEGVKTLFKITSPQIRMIPSSRQARSLLVHLTLFAGFSRILTAIRNSTK